MYHYESESKKESSQWKIVKLSPPKKSNNVHSKIMTTVIFYHDDFMYQYVIDI